MEIVPIAKAGPRVKSKRRNGGVVEVEILILHLCRPIRREHVFETTTDGVTGVAAIDQERRIKDGDHGQSAVITECDTTLGIEQSRSPRVAETAGHRPKPLS